MEHDHMIEAVAPNRTSSAIAQQVARELVKGKCKITITTSRIHVSHLSSEVITENMLPAVAPAITAKPKPPAINGRVKSDH